MYYILINILFIIANYCQYFGQHKRFLRRKRFSIVLVTRIIFLGYYQIRVQTDGSPLPNARLLNLELFLTRETYHVDENNILLMSFAQLIAHDISGLFNDVPENKTSKLIISFMPFTFQPFCVNI